MLLKFFISCSLIFLAGCGSKAPKYEIGVDPSWAPLDFQTRQSNIMGFSTELLQAVSLDEKISISLLQVNWDVLFEGLNKGKYQAILSSLQPFNFNSDLYSFSEVFLATGPVLVMPIGSTQKSLKELQGKAIAALQGTPEVLLLEKYPGISISTYDDIPVALNDLVAGKVQGALLPVLPTSAYVRDLYQRRLKIVTAPLTDEGLRLITFKDKAPKLIKAFDKTLNHMKKNGDYEKQLVKWQLAYPTSK